VRAGIAKFSISQNWKKKNPPIRPWWFQIHRRMTGHVCRQIRHSGHSLGVRFKQQPVITGFSRCPPSGRVGRKETRLIAGWGRSGQRTTKNAVRHRRMQIALALALSLSLSLSRSLLPVSLVAASACASPSSSRSILRESNRWSDDKVSPCFLFLFLLSSFWK